MAFPCGLSAHFLRLGAGHWYRENASDNLFVAWSLSVILKAKSLGALQTDGYGRCSVALARDFFNQPMDSMHGVGVTALVATGQHSRGPKRSQSQFCLIDEEHIKV